MKEKNILNPHTRSKESVGKFKDFSNNKIMFSRKAPIVLAASAIILLSGCSAVGPDYNSPQMKVPDKWQTEDSGKLTAENIAAKQWWRLFNDPVLDGLILEASESNLDLKEAMARVDEYRSRLGVTTGSKVPEVSTTGQLTRQKNSKNAGYSGAVNTYKGLGVEAGWEIDLFGRVRRSVEAAKADYQATQEDKNDVMISLYSRVALTYIDIRTSQARLVATNANIESQQELLKLTESRFKYGLATDLEVAQAEQTLASSEATVPPLRIQLSQSINTLSLLLGRAPGTLNGILSEYSSIPVSPENATVGVPANLLRQRPDIRSAERQLAAQSARIGIAKADLYPQFSLSGSFGYQTVGGNLLSSGSNHFSLGPSLRWNIFSGGSILNQIDVQDALARQKAIQYESTVLTALGEVENALTAYTENRNRLTSLEKTVASSERAVRLSVKLYKQGLVNFQSVLDAQRNQFDSENQLAQAKGDSAGNFVTLYTALGGGWDPSSIEVTSEQKVK